MPRVQAPQPCDIDILAPPQVRPMLQFMAACRDPAVVAEVADALLCVLVDGGARAMAAVVDAARGPEEFAAFVMKKLVATEDEALRCAGLRLLTHFYLRVDLLPVSSLVMTLKRRKGSMVTRTMETLSKMSGSAATGLARLEACGGLAWVLDTLTRAAARPPPTSAASHLHPHPAAAPARLARPTTGTYRALLEMLLATPGGRSQGTVQYHRVADGASSSVSVSVSMSAPASASPRLQGGASDPHSTDDDGVGRRSVAFSPQGLRPSGVPDEPDGLNAVALPYILQLLPTLPPAAAGDVYRDLLALVTHSAENRDAFLACPLWQMSVFALVRGLVAPATEPLFGALSAAAVEAQVAAALAEAARVTGAAADAADAAGAGAGRGAGPPHLRVDVDTPAMPTAAAPALAAATAEGGDADDVPADVLDLRFALGMKVRTPPPPTATTTTATPTVATTATAAP